MAFLSQFAGGLPGRRRRNGKQSGFTLIELVVVVLIILILVVVLLVAILIAMAKGKRADTIETYNAIRGAMSAWRDGTGAGASAYPKSGPNTSLSGGGKFEGAKRLYQELVAKPKAAGKDPYITVKREAIGWIDKEGNLLSSGTDAEAVFLDGWGMPIVYFEWASIAALESSSGDSDVPGGKTRTVNAKVPKWAMNTSSYDLYSAGVDKKWGTDDDMLPDQTEGKSPLSE